jgi:DNA-binding response OmpR family regulator
MKKMILVIDDDQAILDAISLALERAGYDVQTSTDGRCLLEISNKRMPDLILLDILLSGEDGRELCIQLKEREETRHIPVILCSAHFSGDVITYFAGASTFLPKPFHVRELLATVERFLPSASNQPHTTLPDDTLL